ncbi:PIN domain-containing protein [Neolewinella antarctica]|uniref:tRNA(fMet)-specific endonuclease VapC n=1 Tax=Neolewinella antarctica TaxID=442734 RepID=A0ABX0XCL7_9BACT|nr:PIN domain-containing protein [Neolewinella antarctica]NJC26689.1 tRNA(fMet)-specific endonuclease VapC [Neolewinella antarctica]
MNSYLLDTNIIAAYLHDHKSVPDKIFEVGIENCYVPKIAIAELYYGTYFGTRIEHNLKQIEKTVADFTILPIANCLENYGIEKASLRKRKIPMVGSNDLFIAAIAISYNLTLVTNNTKDFKNITPLVLEDWTKSAHNEFLRTI